MDLQFPLHGYFYFWTNEEIPDGEDDYYDKQDFSYENFLFLPPGESEIFFDPGVREEATCEIDFKEEYIAHQEKLCN